MNVVDSSGWLEYFAGGSNSDFFAPAIEDLPNLVVPTLCLFEVFKRVLQQRNDDDALRVIATMHQARVVELDSPIALRAAQLSVAQKLPMADSIILATAQSFDAVLWTQDSNFKSIDGVRYTEK